MTHGCEGKKAYPTFALAKKGSERARRGDRNTQPYHCQHCNQFHTGGAHPKDKRAFKVQHFERALRRFARYSDE